MILELEKRTDKKRFTITGEQNFSEKEVQLPGIDTLSEQCLHIHEGREMLPSTKCIHLLTITLARYPRHLDVFLLLWLINIFV